MTPTQIERIRRKVAKYSVRVTHAMTNVPARTLYRFVGGMTPRYETMAKLEKWAKGVR